jgi:hypothetical protein
MNGEIDIRLCVTEDKEITSNKRKHKVSKEPVWKLEQPSGPPHPFSDTHWGGATRDYMSLLDEVPPDAMETIMYEARLVAASQKARTSKATVPSKKMHSGRAALAFR